MRLALRIALITVIASTVLCPGYAPQDTAWRATLELTPGAHQLRAEALHPFMLYTASATNWFTNTGPAEIISDGHDGSGRITSRIWKTGTTTNSTETWSWDAKGRLWRISQRDSTQNGFDETHVYDPSGRRLQTTRLPYTNGVAISNSAIVTKQVYDPEHEFLELGASRNGEMMWKLYGPDLNGIYGSLNGLGGFDAIIPAAELFCPVIADSLGNLHGIYDQGHATFEWFSSRVTALGSVPGYEPVPYGQGAPSIAHGSAWRGKWLDDVDRVQWGVRPYLMDSARFAAPDPLGHNGGNENPYTGSNGRPDMFDADGRLARQTWDHSIFGNAPAPREVVVQRDPTQGFWSRIFGLRYIDQNGNRVDKSLDIVRVDSRGMTVDPLGGEPPGGGMIRAGARTGVSLWSRFMSLFRSGGDDAANLRLSETVAGHLRDVVSHGANKGQLARPYLNSQLTVREIMSARSPIPDPGGVPGALRWDVPGQFRGSSGTWELVVDPGTQRILHFLFKTP